ncbi:hypothetical protein ACTXT7_009010 [Hymenolepis weldensis]
MSSRASAPNPSYYPGCWTLLIKAENAEKFTPTSPQPFQDEVKSSEESPKVRLTKSPWLEIIENVYISRGIKREENKVPMFKTCSDNVKQCFLNIAVFFAWLHMRHIFPDL